MSVEKVIQIRPVRAEDLKSLAKVYCEVYGDIDGEWPAERAYDRLDLFRRQQPELSLLAEYQGTGIVGGAFGRIEGWRDKRILVSCELFVLPSAQRRRAGSKLLLTLLDLAENKYEATIYRGLQDPNYPGWVKKIGLNPTGLVQVEGPISEIRQRLS